MQIVTCKECGRTDVPAEHRAVVDRENGFPVVRLMKLAHVKPNTGGDLCEGTGQIVDEGGARAVAA